MIAGHAAVEWLWQFSLHRCAHYARFRKLRLQQLQLQRVLAARALRPLVVADFYTSGVTAQHKTWIHVCELSTQLAHTFPDVQIFDAYCDNGASG